MSQFIPRARLLGTLAALALVGVTAVGCSSGQEDAMSAGASRTAPAPASNLDLQRNAVGDSVDSLDSTVESAAKAASVPEAPEDLPTRRAVISTGNVALRSTDVAKARFDVQKIVDRFRGEVSQEQTETDEKGVVNRSRLVLRIPSAGFRDAMQALEDAADLISSDTNLDDVTTEVIDVDVRLRVQRHSIARIEQLLDRAQDIGDIISIESQLSRRQATLGSLERRQAYLADQTSLSTITVSLERTPKHAVPPRKDTTGFVAGLRAGWDGLTTAGVAVATVTGALLPWMVALLVLAVPGWPLSRRLLRRRTTTPEPADA